MTQKKDHPAENTSADNANTSGAKSNHQPDTGDRARTPGGGQSSELTEAAHLWFKAHYCVIPSHDDGGKRPFGLWANFQDKRMEWDHLLELLNTGKYTGIGVITGKASGNVEMIEIEGPSDAAVERLRRVIDYAKELDRQAGDTWFTDLINRVTRGCVERSAGGGLHFFIRIINAPALGNTKLAHDSDGKVLAETRGQGGFVIVAPTPARTGHPEGATYAFARGTTPAGTVDVTEEERDALHMLFTLALNEHVEEPQPERKTTTTQPTGDSTFDQYRSTSWADILEPAGWTWSHKHKDRDYWVRPGKTKTEGISATTIEDGPMVNFSTSVNMPIEKGMSKADVYAYLHHSGDLSAAARDLYEQGYGTRHHQTINEFRFDGAEGRPDEQGSAAPTKTTLSEKLLTRDKLATLPTPEPLIHDTLDRRTVAALVGNTGTLKSWLALDWAACVATGKTWHGREVEQGTVLYIASEGAHGLHQRLESWEYVWKTPIPSDAFHVLPTPVQITNDGQRAQLTAIIRDLKPDLTIIDTVARCAVGLDENSAKDMGLFVDALYRIRGENNGTVLGVHHTGKDGKTTRGSSAFEDGVDTVYLSKGDAGLIELARTKRKDGPTEDQLRFTLKSEHMTGRAWLEKASGRHIASGARKDDMCRVLAETFPGEEFTAAKARAATGAPEGSIYRLLAALVEEGRLTKVGTAFRPRYVVTKE